MGVNLLQVTAQAPVNKARIQSCSSVLLTLSREPVSQRKILRRNSLFKYNFELEFCLIDLMFFYLYADGYIRLTGFFLRELPPDRDGVSFISIVSRLWDGHARNWFDSWHGHRFFSTACGLALDPTQPPT